MPETKQFSVTFDAPPEGSSRRQQLDWIAQGLTNALFTVVGEIEPTAESMRIHLSAGENTWTAPS